jgi:hypothetical protein
VSLFFSVFGISPINALYSFMTLFKFMYFILIKKEMSKRMLEIRFPLSRFLTILKAQYSLFELPPTCSHQNLNWWISL